MNDDYLIGDLHVHSRNSDGSLTLEEIVCLASKQKLNYVAITDHNFLNSKSNLLKLSKKFGVKIIYGLEISCFDFKRKRKVHVLCYGNFNEEILAPICKRATEIRIENGLKKAEFVLQKFSIPNQIIEKYKSFSGIIYQQNLVHALMECGYCNSIYGELYDCLSSKNLGLKTKQDLDVFEVLNLIHKAGGKAIVAHPYVYDSLNLVNELIEHKLIDGLEIWHPKNSKSEQQNLLELVKKNNLVATGGTDFHGFYSSVYLNKIGQFHAPKFYVEKFFDLIKK